MPLPMAAFSSSTPGSGTTPAPRLCASPATRASGVTTTTQSMLSTPASAACTRQAEFGHDLGGRTFHRLAGDDGGHGDDRRAAGLECVTHAGHGQDRIDAEPWVRRADDDAGKVWRRQSLEHLTCRLRPID